MYRKLGLIKLIVVICLLSVSTVYAASSVEGLLTKAVEFEKSKNYPKAIAFYTRLNRSEPNNIEYLVKLTELYNLVAKPFKAAKYAKKTLEKNPNQIEALMVLGIGALKSQDFDQALIYFETILKNNPNNNTAKLNLSMALDGLGKTVDAEALRKQMK